MHKKFAFDVLRVARELVSDRDPKSKYKYRHDPQHQHRPKGPGWEETDSGWRYNPDAAKGKPEEPEEKRKPADVNDTRYAPKAKAYEALKNFDPNVGGDGLLDGMKALEGLGGESWLTPQEKDNQRISDILKKAVVAEGKVSRKKLLSLTQRMAQAITDPAKAGRRGAAFLRRQEAARGEDEKNLLREAKNIFYGRARELLLEKHKQYDQSAESKPVPAPAPAPRPAAPARPAPAPAAPDRELRRRFDKAKAELAKADSMFANPDFWRAYGDKADQKNVDKLEKMVEKWKKVGPPAPPTPRHPIVKKPAAKRSLNPVQDILRGNELSNDSDEVKELAGFKHSIMHHQRLSQKQIDHMKKEGTPFWPRNEHKLKAAFLANMNPANYPSPEAFRNAKDRMQRMPVNDFAKILAAIMSEDEELEDIKI